MRKYKTNKKNRKHYRYYFRDGQTQEISKAETNDEILSLLHHFDDNEVDAQRREDYHVSIHYESFSELDKEKNFFLIDERNPLSALLEQEASKIHEIRLKKLQLAIQTLTSKQQLLIQWVYVENKSLTEIAKSEGVYVSSIHKRLKRIHEQLYKKILKN